ncbi:MAG: hypothetical protein ABJL99_16090 [Aliishimia sp.]
MGSLRRGLILACLTPSALWAEVCDKARPAWDGNTVSAWQEAVFLFSTLPALVLIVASMLAIRFRHQWGALVVVVLWTLLVTMVSMADPTGIQKLAAAEGCVGSPALFIGVVAAICGGMILYTVPRAKRLE